MAKVSSTLAAHRTASLKFLNTTGLIPVKIRPGQKDAFPDWEPRTVANADHSITFKEIENNPDLNVGALFSGRYVDVDIDCTSPLLKQALEYFLPRTPWVFGRASKPKSHRIYALHEDFDRPAWAPLLKYIKNLGEGKIDGYSYSIEVRGGKPESGLYTVLPGSYRADAKEEVLWDAEIDPTVGGAYVEIDQLMRAIRLALVASFVAPHWVSGVRNDLNLALAGTLWRIRASTLAAYGLDGSEDGPPGVFVMNEEDAQALVGCICSLADDDTEDRRDRMTNLKNTWRKLEGDPGARVTGGKAMAMLIGEGVGEKVVKTMYRLLSDNDSAEQIEKMSEQFVMWYGPGVILDLDQVAQGRLIPWMTKEQATNSLGGKKLSIGDKKIPIVNMLFGSTVIRRVMGLTFDPSCDELVVDTPEGPMVNQWKGWAVKPSDQRVTFDEIKMFYDYVVEIVADGNQDRAEWVFAWMADMFQQPHRKPGTSLVLVGVQGAGKTFLGEKVLGQIIGPSHYKQINSIEQLTSKFNTGIDNKVFVQCDEAIHKYQRDVSSRLKSIITDGTLTIEPKGINSYTKPNHLHLLFTSNEETDAIFIDPSPHERRFTVFKVSAARATDNEYWRKMHEWTEINLGKILRWLLDYKYDRNLITRPIITDAKRDIQRVGVDPEVSWILSRMAYGHIIGRKNQSFWYEAYHEDHITLNDKKNNIIRRDHWPNMVHLPALEDDFKKFVREHGRTVYSGSVMTQIKKVLPPGAMQFKGQTTVRMVDPKSDQVSMERIRIYSLAPIPEIMAHLRSRYGPVVDAMFEDLKDDEQGGAEIDGGMDETDKF